MPRLILDLSSDPLIGAKPDEQQVDLWVETVEDGRRFDRHVGRLLVPGEILGETRKLTASIAAAFPKLELAWRRDGELLPPEASDWKITKAIRLLRRFLT